MVFRYATADQVASVWLSSVVGVATGDQLPSESTTWAASGFVLCSDAGGSSNIYYELDAPVYMLDCWTCDPGSPFPPWELARNIAETIRKETYRHQPRNLTLPFCDENARVLQSQVVGRVHRKWGDLGDYACYSVDVMLHWIPLPKP